MRKPRGIIALDVGTTETKAAVAFQPSDPQYLSNCVVVPVDWAPGGKQEFGFDMNNLLTPTGLADGTENCRRLIGLRYATIDGQRYLSALREEDHKSTGADGTSLEGSPAFEHLRNGLRSDRAIFTLPELYQILTANVELWLRKFILPQLELQVPVELHKTFVPIILVITVPCAFSTHERLAWAKAIKAGFRAGLVDEVVIITEPHAAFLEILTGQTSFVELDNKFDFVVCDIGGSTMDMIAFEQMSRTNTRLHQINNTVGGCYGSEIAVKCLSGYLNKALRRCHLDLDMEGDVNDSLLPILKDAFLRMTYGSTTNVKLPHHELIQPSLEDGQDLTTVGFGVDQIQSHGRLVVTREGLEQNADICIEAGATQLTNFLSGVCRKRVAQNNVQKPLRVFMTGGFSQNAYLQTIFENAVSDESVARTELQLDAKLTWVPFQKSIVALGAARLPLCGQALIAPHMVCPKVGWEQELVWDPLSGTPPAEGGFEPCSRVPGTEVSLTLVNMLDPVETFCAHGYGVTHLKNDNQIHLSMVWSFRHDKFDAGPILHSPGLIDATDDENRIRPLFNVVIQLPTTFVQRLLENIKVEHGTGLFAGELEFHCRYEMCGQDLHCHFEIPLAGHFDCGMGHSECRAQNGREHSTKIEAHCTLDMLENLDLNQFLDQDNLPPTSIVTIVSENEMHEPPPTVAMSMQGLALTENDSMEIDG